MKVGDRVKIVSNYRLKELHNKRGTLISINNAFHYVRLDNYYTSTYRFYKDELTLIKRYPNTELYRKLYPHGKIIGNFYEI